MKKLIFIFLIFFSFLLIGCNKPIEIEKIFIKQLPNKIEYTIDEQLDLDGLVVEAFYSDNTKKVIEDYEIVKGDFFIGLNTIIIQYQNFKTSFEVLIKEKIQIISISIKQLPNKVEYVLNEQLNLDGLIVEANYTDNTKKVIEDYEIEYDQFQIGTNTIKIKYQNFETSFDITFKELEKLQLLEYPNLKTKINNSLNKKEYDLLFDSIIYGGYRDTDTMIIFDEEYYVNTNIYGYEISVDEYGYVVEANTKVSLVKNGFVISGHGIKAKLLKQVEVGDFVIYLDKMVFIYKNNESINQNKLFIKFLDIIENLNNINDVIEYNNIVVLLNEIIPSINSLYNEYDLNLSSQLIDNLDEINLLINNKEETYEHEYSYYPCIYSDIKLINPNINNYIYHSSFEDKIYYGGFRNQDTIVHYNKDTYRDRNKYGYEVAVNSDNIIIQKDVLVDLPENGYILSGHGTGSDFIKDNLSIGNKIEIKDDIIYCYCDVITTVVNDLINERNDVINILMEHESNSIPHNYQYLNKLINNIDLNINELITIIENKNFNYDLYNKISLIKKEIATAYSLLIDYKIDETRAMWYYPFNAQRIYDDTSLEGVMQTLDKFKEMGFNEIIILPFHGDYILYDSMYFYKYDKLNNYSYGEYGNDYLKCFITEAHKRGILVNAFTQTFRCFEEGSKLLNDEHYQKNIDGSYSEGNILYYDICNDYVQEVLTSWYIELVSKYDFDKIEYDIIRYSATNLHSYLDVDVITDVNRVEDPGFTKYSMDKFLKLNNLTGDLKTLIINDKEIRAKWLEFKENELINFITTTTNEIKKIKPNIVISAAVMNNYQEAKKTFLQDYKKWLDLGIIDEIEPMAYHDDSKYVLEKVIYFNTNFNEYNYRLGLGYDLHSIVLMKQVIYSSKDGFVLFEASDFLRNEFYELFSNSYHFKEINDFNNKEEVLNVIKLDVINKIQNYFEVKNNVNYDNIINVINNDFNNLEKEINNLEDEKMKNYLLEVFNL